MNILNQLSGILRSLIAASWAGMSVVLTKKLQNNSNIQLSEDKIILSNWLHISIIWNIMGTFELITENPWTAYTHDLQWFFILIFGLSVITYISLKFILKTIKIESPPIVSIYEFQGIIFTAILDSLILGTSFRLKDYIAGALIILPNLVVSLIKFYGEK